MEPKDENIFASIKYEGHLVEDGFLDARRAGEALIGIDEILRYFLYQENPEFEKIKFEVPVRVRKGSWETIFPENINEVLIKTSLTWGAMKYFGSALGEMAKRDFKDVGFKDVFQQAFKGLTWVVKVAVHLGSLTKKKLEKLKFSKDNKEVGLTNDEGEILWVPTDYLELFTNCPPKLFSNLARVIEEERELVISYNKDKEIETARVNHKRKFIFIPEEDEEEILFPELEHGQYVELEGHISRGNENSNTIGFFYENHVLTCIPDSGNVRDYRQFLFSNCILKGYVDRLDKKGDYKEKRPRIRFIHVVSTAKPDNQQRLFE
ncbi:hypothetical protein [Arenibacter lacus]|uniref:hypothetical protein n=1 Tax=Arenibacter lacus TaxID=2608629 RepID=UPI00123D11AD|nr:hypothetical protein [Arenibacter lacus]